MLWNGERGDFECEYIPPTLTSKCVPVVQPNRSLRSGRRSAGAGPWRERSEGGKRQWQNSVEMVQPVQAMEPSWLTRPWSVAQIFSALKSLSNLTEVAGSSSDLSHLLTSARDLSQSIEIYISAPLQWWKIHFISLWCGATCCLGMCSGKTKLRGKGLSSFA